MGDRQIVNGYLLKKEKKEKNNERTYACLQINYAEATFYKYWTWVKTVETQSEEIDHYRKGWV